VDPGIPLPQLINASLDEATAAAGRGERQHDGRGGQGAEPQRREDRAAGTSPCHLCYWVRRLPEGDEVIAEQVGVCEEEESIGGGMETITNLQEKVDQHKARWQSIKLLEKATESIPKFVGIVCLSFALLAIILTQLPSSLSHSS